MPINPFTNGFMPGESLGIPTGIPDAIANSIYGGGGAALGGAVPHTVAPPHVNMGNNAAHNQMMQMRMLRYMRPMLPMHDGQGRAVRQRNPLLSGDSGTDFTQLMRDQATQKAANDMLGEYGLSLPKSEDINPNAFLPNSGFFGRHPKLAAMIEGGVLGGMHGLENGGDGVGQQIASGLRGGMEAVGDRRNAVNNQIAQPFNLWHQMAAMEKESMSIDDMRALRDERLRKAQDPMSKFYGTHIDSNTGLIVGIGANGMEELPGQRDKAGKPMYDFGKPTPAAKAPTSYTPYFRTHGWDEETATPDQWKTVKTEIHNDQKELVNMRARAPYENNNRDPDQLKHILSQGDEDMKGMLWQKNDKAVTQQLIGSHVAQKDWAAKIADHNLQLRQARSRWEQGLRGGTHNTPFSLWINQGSQQDSGAASPMGGGGGSRPLQQLLPQMRSKQSQTNPMAAPKYFVPPGSAPQPQAPHDFNGNDLQNYMPGGTGGKTTSPVPMKSWNQVMGEQHSHNSPTNFIPPEQMQFVQQYGGENTTPTSSNSPMGGASPTSSSPAGLSQSLALLNFYNLMRGQQQ